MSAESTIRIQMGSSSALIPNAMINREKMLGKVPNSLCIPQQKRINKQNNIMLKNGPITTILISSTVFSSVF